MANIKNIEQKEKCIKVYVKYEDWIALVRRLRREMPGVKLSAYGRRCMFDATRASARAILEEALSAGDEEQMRHEIRRAIEALV